MQRARVARMMQYDLDPRTRSRLPSHSPLLAGAALSRHSYEAACNPMLLRKEG